MQVHEHFIASAENEERGAFVIDQHIGSSTEFQLYTMGPRKTQGFVKGITINDIRQSKYLHLDDRLEYHYLSVYKVPFESVCVKYYISLKLNLNHHLLHFPCQMSGISCRAVDEMAKHNIVDDHANKNAMIMNNFNF